MSTYESQMIGCPYCRRNTPHKRRAVNHVLHLLISLFACGFWLPMWFCLCICKKPWVCQHCGYHV